MAKAGRYFCVAKCVAVYGFRGMCKKQVVLDDNSAYRDDGAAVFNSSSFRFHFYQEFD